MDNLNDFTREEASLGRNICALVANTLIPGSLPVQVLRNMDLKNQSADVALRIIRRANYTEPSLIQRVKSFVREDLYFVGLTGVCDLLMNVYATKGLIDYSSGDENGLHALTAVLVSKFICSQLLYSQKKEFQRGLENDYLQLEQVGEKNE